MYPRFVKKHRLLAALISVLLCLFFVCPPLQAGPGDQNQVSPEPQSLWLCGLVMLVVAGFIIWKLYQFCKKNLPPTPPPEPPPPPPALTNFPPITNYPPVAVAAFDTGPDGAAGIGSWNVMGIPGQAPWQGLVGTDLQGSRDGKTWSTDFHVLLWYQTNSAIVLLAVYNRDWQLQVTRYGNVSDRTVTACPVPAPTEASRFYRLAVPKSFR